MPIAQPKSPLLPDFDLLISGSALPPEVKVYVTEVVIDDDTRLPGMFTLKLVGADTQKEWAESITAMPTLPWIDDETLFAVGNVVEVKLGYRDDLETVLIGEITGLEPAFTFNQLPRLTVRGYDRRHRLHNGRKTRTFVQQKDSDIAAQIANELGLSSEVVDSQVTHDYVLQANQSDMDFLQERARRIQYEVVVADKTLHFRPIGNAESEILAMTLDDHLLEFYPRLSAVRQLSEVTVRGWDPKEKKEIVGQAKLGDEVSTMGGETAGGKLSDTAFGASATHVGDRPIVTQAEADQLALARFNQVALALIEGDGVCWGRTDLRAGTVIKIDGIGKRFSGQYYVTAVNHRYTAQRGYYTRFSVQRNAI